MKIKPYVYLLFLWSFIGIYGSLQAQEGQPQIIAHRGAWKAQSLPENSIASLQQAIALGCVGSEFDVWLTADGVPVVNHNADYYGLMIEQTSYDSLRTRKHPNGEEIPTLQAYLDAGKGQQNTRLILEIKTSQMSKDRTLTLTQACVEQVQASGMRKMVDYISFDYDAGLKVLELDPGAQVAFLSADLSAPAPMQLQQAGFTGLDYHVNVIKAHPEWLEGARDLGLTTNVWTVNQRSDMAWMQEGQLDFITTDEPETLKEVLEQSK